MYLVELILKMENGPQLINENSRGYLVRAFFLEWIGGISVDKVQSLHETNKIRPYSIQINEFDNHSTLKIRIILYEDNWGEIISNDVVNKFRNDIYIGSDSYCLMGVNQGPINIKAIFTHSNPIKKFSISFLSPTYFHTMKGDYPVRLPIPIVIFSNLLSKCSKLFELEAFEVDTELFLGWIEAHVYVSSCNIKTQKVPLGNNRFVAGFQGVVSFQIKKINAHFYEKSLGLKNEDEMKEQHAKNSAILNFLCKMGEYTNLGINSTAGCGTINFKI